MSTNVYGLRLRSAVRSRRQRLLRTAIGLALLALLCLVYPGARDLTAQLLGIGSTPSVAVDVTTDEPEGVTATRRPRHAAGNPLAMDARAAAGLILPTVPPEPELVAYVSGEQPLVVDFDDAVSDEFGDVQPASVADGIGGGSGWLGRRFAGVPSLGATSGGIGAGAGSAGAAGGAGVAPDAVIASNETAAGGERARVLGDRASESFASTALVASKPSKTEDLNSNGGTNGGGAANPAVASNTGGSTINAGGGASEATSATNGVSGAATTLADSVPADIAPGAMVIADLAAPPAARSDSSVEGAQTTPATAVAAGAPGVLADVPEPPMLLIFGLGLAALGYRMQARRA